MDKQQQLEQKLEDMGVTGFHVAPNYASLKKLAKEGKTVEELK